MTTVPGWDCTHANLPHAPSSGQAAGYTTGSVGIAWTPADWAAHPHAVRIDQDAGASDGTADVLDVEPRAATAAECPGWVNRARNSYKAATRPGQRQPAIYVNRSNVTAVANALASAGLTGVGLWLADWSLTVTEAAAEVANASGPYPVVAVQYSDQGGRGAYDLDVFSSEWLNAVSGKTPAPPDGPYRHVAPRVDGESLGHVADSRNTTVAHILSVSQAQLSPEHLAVLKAYIALEDAMTAAGMSRPAMPGGLIYYTQSP
jgi:hypothetical protein